MPSFTISLRCPTNSHEGDIENGQKLGLLPIFLIPNVYILNFFCQKTVTIFLYIFLLEGPLMHTAREVLLYQEHCYIHIIKGQNFAI